MALTWLTVSSACRAFFSEVDGFVSASIARTYASSHLLADMFVLSVYWLYSGLRSGVLGSVECSALCAGLVTHVIWCYSVSMSVPCCLCTAAHLCVLL
jgi:hypothetical protein